jgi:hypothetical protein
MAHDAAYVEFIEGLPEELKNLPQVFYAPYGFKLVEIDGKKLWQPGTFEEYKEAEAKRRGVEPSTITPKDSRGCYNNSPTTCAGGCPQYTECGGYVYGGYTACGCYS